MLELLMIKMEEFAQLVPKLDKIVMLEEVLME